MYLDETEVFFCDIEDLKFHVQTSRTHIAEVIGGRDLAEFGLVQIAAYPRPTATLLSAISAYLEYRRKPLANMGAISAPTKLYQLMVLAQSALPVPTTIYLSRRLLNDSFTDIAAQLGLPFVLKAINASGGRLNYLIETEVDFLRFVHDPRLAEVAFLAQEFIPNNGTFRTLVFGKDVPIVMHRCSTDSAHLSNTERGGHATLFDVDTFDGEALDLSLRAAELMGCDVAGVNLVQHRQTRQWYVLEVNSSPAIGSGAFAKEKTEAYSSYLRARLSQVEDVRRAGRDVRESSC
ncbi:hypothetical protein GCM10010129_73380 [Streptomyces fumigatiscleroticus]|nr:hypothetical protein GCM10010129_73380 [Streptomyces fumigatiscleroticus]